MKHVIVIGGGAAGMLAALFSAREGAKVTLLEHNEKLGKKLYITGKGRCNVTNAEDMDGFMRRIFRNPRFLYAAFAQLDNRALMALIEAQGVPLKVERGDRVFPVSDKASDIIGALQRALARAGVNVRLNTGVQALDIADGACRGVMLDDGEALAADAVIVATGGISYPSTGSTGDGYRFAEQAGHGIKTPMPGLTAIETRESWPANLMGLSLKNVALNCWVRGSKKEKKLYGEQGELLFTHFGISGPLVLTLSSLLPEDLSGARMAIDLKPALDEQTLDARLLRDFKAMPNKRLITVMDGLEPHSLAEQVLRLAGVSPNLPVNAVTAAQRRDILNTLKALPLTPKGLRGFNEAIVTRGGVDVKGVNPSTMESKRVKGLYFAGEVLDVDAQTGGFNLQIAFSTGALAGASAARSSDDESVVS